METSLNQETINKIKELAALFFSPKEVAIMLGLDVQQFVKDCKREDTDAYNAFRGGRLEQIALHRKKVIELAVKSGSSPAQTMVDKMISDSEAKLNDR